MPIQTSPRTAQPTIVRERTRHDFDGDDFVALLRTNPSLAQSKLMFQLSATSDQQTVHARNSAALLCETQPRRAGMPRQLGGDIDLRRSPTTAAARPPADLDHAPTKRDLVNLVAAEELAHDLLAAGYPATLPEQTACLEFHASVVAQRWAGHGLERRSPMFIEAAARYLTTVQPDGLDFATTNALRKWHGDTRDTHLDSDPDTDHRTGDGLDVSFISRRRIAWTHPDGPATGLLLDRFHTACRPGGVERDLWARRKVAEDLAATAAFLGPALPVGGEEVVLRRALLGVRVLAHRAPKVGTHFLPRFVPGQAVPVVGDHHPIGDCAICATTKAVQA